MATPLALMALLGAGPATSHAQQADTSATQQVEIVNADSLARTSTAGDRRERVLAGNVRLRQGTMRLRADRATQRPGAGEIIFTGDVLIIDEGDSLWADRARYDSRRKVGRATGEVRVSSGGEVLLAGPVGRYFFEEERALFPRRVTLIDSARVLKSRGGEYFSRPERAEFYRQVRVFSDSTYLEADSVTYRRRSEVTKARGNVFIERRGDRASPGEEEAGTGEEAPSANRDAGAQRAAPGSAAPDKAARPDTATRLGPARPDTLDARARRPSLLGRPLPVDTTRRALLPDTTARTLLWGRRAYNDPQDGYSRVTGRALLVRLQPPDSSEAAPPEAAPSEADTTASPTPQARPDTLIVRARRLETARSDTLRRLTATDSVRLWQQDLQAVADSSVYDRRPDRAEPARRAGRPRNAPPDTAARADMARAGSVARTDTARADSTGRPPPRRESRFFGGPISWSAGGNGGGPSRRQLSGDSLRVTGRAGTVRRLHARGNAFLVQEDSVLEGRFQQLKGRRIRGRFARDSTGETTLRRLVVRPNAEVIYFRKKDDGTLAGAVRASSDSVVFHLRGGELKKARWLSSPEGVAPRAPNVPDPFRLDGFRWVPERRPRKGAFLREKRVRRRLVRPDAPPPTEPRPKEPPPTEPPPAEPPPATAAGGNAPDDPTGE